MEEWFDKFIDLYINSFPDDERRNIDIQSDLLKNPLYNIEPIYFNNEWAGFMCWWNFKDFAYIEHFATSPKYRNNGLGKSFLTQFVEKHPNTALEVEIPEDDLSKRRVEFYKRVGFKLLDDVYMQPAYDQNKQSIPLKLMVFLSNSKLDFETIRDTIYKNVFSL